MYITPFKFLIIFNFNKGENDRILFDKFKMNLLMKLILPSRDCNSILVVGGTVSSIAFILFWPISIPLSWTMKPKNYLAYTLKAHLLGFIFRPYFLSNSCIKADPIVWSLVDTYNLKGSPCWGGTSTGGHFMYSFISSNAFVEHHPI